MIHNCSKTPCRWRRRKEARPEEILDAALKMFTEKGFSSTRMIDVAREAGISKGTLYLYFESKERIFEELLKTKIAPMLEESELAIENFSGSMAELIEALGLQWWNSIWYCELSSIPKLIAAEAGNFPQMAEFYVESIVKRIRKIFKSILQQGIENGEFQPIDVDTTARLLMAPVIQATVWKHSLQPFDKPINEQQYIQLHLQIFLKGISKEK